MSKLFGRLLDRLRQGGDGSESVADPVAAAAAVLFLEVAWADHDLAEVELDLACEALGRALAVEAGVARQLVDEARPGLEHSVGLQTFTRALVDAWPEEQRYRLLVELWRLALADMRLDKYEEATIRRIAELLYVSHARFIEAKQAARRVSAAEP